MKIILIWGIGLMTYGIMRAITEILYNRQKKKHSEFQPDTYVKYEKHSSWNYLFYDDY